jgi:hypothetical protein
MSDKKLLTVPRESITRECSAEAFQKVIESGKLEKNKLLVYQTLYHYGPLTQEETWKIIIETKSPDELGGKLPELRDITPSFAPMDRQGLIKCLGGVKSSKNTTVSLWDVTDRDYVAPDPLKNRKALETNKQKIARLEKENELLKKSTRFYMIAAKKHVKLNENEQILNYHNQTVKSLLDAKLDFKDKDGNSILVKIGK